MYRCQVTYSQTGKMVTSKFRQWMGYFLNI